LFLKDNGLVVLSIVAAATLFLIAVYAIANRRNQPKESTKGG
jgi:hypothetical protein